MIQHAHLFHVCRRVSRSLQPRALKGLGFRVESLGASLWGKQARRASRGAGREFLSHLDCLAPDPFPQDLAYSPVPQPEMLTPGIPAKSMRTGCQWRVSAAPTGAAACFTQPHQHAKMKRRCTACLREPPQSVLRSHGLTLLTEALQLVLVVVALVVGQPLLAGGIGALLDCKIPNPGHRQEGKGGVRTRLAECSTSSHSAAGRPAPPAGGTHLRCRRRAGSAWRAGKEWQTFLRRGGRERARAQSSTCQNPARIFPSTATRGGKHAPPDQPW